MASAQVLSNPAAASTRKKEHLEAGKRRLEEFRKKKAAERAKKSVSTIQPLSDVSLSDKQPLDIGNVRADIDGAVTSDRPGNDVIEPSSVLLNNEIKAVDIGHERIQVSSNDTLFTPLFSEVNHNRSFADQVQTKDEEYNTYDDASRYTGSVDISYGQESKELNNGSDIYNGDQERFSYGLTSDQFIGLHRQGSQDFARPSSQSILHKIEESDYKENNSFVKNYSPSFSHVSIETQSSGNNLLATKLSSESMPASSHTFPFTKDFIRSTTTAGGLLVEVGKDMHGPVFSDPTAFSFSGRNPCSSISGLCSIPNDSLGFNSSTRGSSNHVPRYSSNSDGSSRRSRPSFVDSLSMHKDASRTISQDTVPEKDSYVSESSKSHSGIASQGTEPEREAFMCNTSKFSNRDELGLSAFPNSSVGPFSKQINQDPFGSFMTSNVVDPLRSNVNESSMEGKHEYYTSKKDENFSALEQHIEDLTQEKFSLQRALDASRTLAESLASENSSLTDSYNQQRGVVNQMKSDMEMLQEEIKSGLVELESVKLEYANVLLECNASDERANFLASEVIDLEEKALKLRSSELKLERQLEKSHSEISAFKKKISSLEKDRRDLQLTIDALQEEKKLLQSKVRKSLASGRAVDLSKNLSDKKDISTSTEDLEKTDTVLNAPNQEMPEIASLLESDAHRFPLLAEDGQSSYEVSVVDIPPEQMRMIQNINNLISELTLEKEELMRALASKLSESSKLKDLNMELSRKLEVQTQRLELLTSQRMVNEHIPARQDLQSVDNTTYADEGDEVVERVLGWIMKHFPGGPSKRRTSKLL